MFKGLSFFFIFFLVVNPVLAGEYVTFDVQGNDIHTEYYDWGWHFTIEMDTEGRTHLISCTDIKLDGDPIPTGHWRNYSPWGPEFYQLTRSWYYQNWSKSRNPENYTASCTFFIN